jgi:hypothetical protein
MPWLSQCSTSWSAAAAGFCGRSGVGATLLLLLLPLTLLMVGGVEAHLVP